MVVVPHKCDGRASLGVHNTVGSLSEGRSQAWMTIKCDKKRKESRRKPQNVPAQLRTISLLILKSAYYLNRAIRLLLSPWGLPANPSLDRYVHFARHGISGWLDQSRRGARSSQSIWQSKHSMMRRNMEGQDRFCCSIWFRFFFVFWPANLRRDSALLVSPAQWT